MNEDIVTLLQISQNGGPAVSDNKAEQMIDLMELRKKKANKLDQGINPKGSYAYLSKLVLRGSEGDGDRPRTEGNPVREEKAHGQTSVGYIDKIKKIMKTRPSSN